MITEQQWKHKPHKLTVITVNVADYESIQAWLGAKSVSILHKEGEPSRVSFDGGDLSYAIHVSDGDLLSKNEQGTVERWSSEEHLKRDYKRS